MRMMLRVMVTGLTVLGAAWAQGQPGREPPSGGPWNNDVLVYRVSPNGEVMQIATFERAGVPTIARMKDGRLVAAHQHFPENNEADFDKVAVRFSPDEGRNWTTPQVIRVEGLPEGMRFPFDPTLVPLPDGRVRLYFTGNMGRTFQRGTPTIHSAIATDGVNYAYEPGVRFAVEGRMVIACAVVLHHGVFHLYAPANGPQMQPGRPPRNQPADRPREGIGYHATSKDGLRFTRVEDVQIEGRRRWLGNAQSDGKVITFFGTGDPGESGFPGAGRPRGGVWIGVSNHGREFRLVQTPPIPVADPGAVALREGGWIVVGTGPPVRGKPGANEGRFPGPEPPRSPSILTHVPSAAGGQRGIAVGILPPLRPRYADGAPVVIHVPGGVTTGGTEGRPEYAGLGFVEIRFAFPGGGRGEGTSGGDYDYRGPNCIRALADVIRFATGQLADQQGRKLQELLSRITVLAENVGLVGSSHGGNACGLVMATHGEVFPDLAFYASMESPYGEGNVNIELGGRDQGVNPAYSPETGVLDLSKLAWSAELMPGPPRRWQGEGAGVRGSLFFDLNGDGRFSESDDYPANAFVQDLGQGAKVWYTPRLIREAQQRKLYGDSRPAHVPTLVESTDYWRWRDAAGSIGAAVRKCPKVAVIVYANERDHVQMAPDHPHILTQVEGFRLSGAKFVRLNPDRAYVERVLASSGPSFPQRPRTLPDNEAGMAWDRSNIRKGLEPADLPVQPYMQAAVCELADRVQAGNWASNLDTVLYPDAPWTAFFGREFSRPTDDGPPQIRPPRGPGGLRPPPGKPPLGPDGVRPPLRKPPLDRAKPRPSADAGPGASQRRVPEAAASREAPLLLGCSIHGARFLRPAFFSAFVVRSEGSGFDERGTPDISGTAGLSFSHVSILVASCLTTAACAGSPARSCSSCGSLVRS